jgi:hypothetical protein
MTDPISGKVASQVAQQAAQAGGEEAAADKAGSGDKASFGDVLSDVQQRDVDAAQGAEQAEAVQQVEAAAEAQKTEGPAATKLRDFMDEMRADETQMSDMMDRSMSGADMSQQELLQMQSLIYGYSQKVELASKAVSNAASGMKQIMNTQV